MLYSHFLLFSYCIVGPMVCIYISPICNVISPICNVESSLFREYNKN